MQEEHLRKRSTILETHDTLREDMESRIGDVEASYLYKHKLSYDIPESSICSIRWRYIW